MAVLQIHNNAVISLLPFRVSHPPRGSSLHWDPLRVLESRDLRCKTAAIAPSKALPLPIQAVLLGRQRNKNIDDCKVPQSFINKALARFGEALMIFRKPAVLAAIVALLLTQAPDTWAASGGMMGGRAFSSGRSSGSAGRTYSAPRTSFSFSAPYAAPSPFFGGGFGPSIYVGPAYGLGIGGGSSFLLLMLGVMAFFFVSGFLTDRSETTLLSSTRKTSVLKLQVGLLGMARSLQRNLDEIAEKADISTTEGLHRLLTETVLSLMRHPDYCISGYSSSDIMKNSESGEKLFNEHSLEERAKFDEETVVNVNSSFRSGVAKSTSSALNNEYIVVTLLVAAEGEFKLPAINSNSDLKEALTRIGSIPEDQLLAVEVLWTPQDENDTLSELEFLRDYPLLRSL